jgi:hypothetical protein
MSAATTEAVEAPASATDPKQSPARSLTPAQEHIDADGKHCTAIVFHPNWDTTIMVKGESATTEFKVSSSSIANASPIWSKAVYGDSVNSCPPKHDLIIELEDNSKALDILLRIIHYEFIKVPKKPELDELYEVTRLTSKYKCTHLVYPWANKWVDCLSTFVAGDKSATDNHKGTWIAWELGAFKLFKRMADSIVSNSMVDSDGDLVNKSGAKFKNLALPPGLLGKLFNYHYHLTLCPSTNLIALRPHHHRPC